MTSVTDDQVLVVERIFAATPEKLWDAWTTPGLLVKWWGPEGMTIPDHSLDLRVGGKWRTTMRNSDGTDHTVSGVYKALDRPHRIVFTWAWHNPDGSRGEETVVTVTFEAVDGGTKLLLDQRSFPTAESRDNHRTGWTSSFNCLEKIL